MPVRTRSKLTLKDSNVLSEVKLWVEGLKSATTDTAFQKYIAKKFRNHMEYGLHNEVATDFKDIGDRILQWGYQRDKLRAEIKQQLSSDFQSYCF